MADPLVLLPGMNCSERLWGSVTGRLRSGGVDVLLPRPLEGVTVDDCVDSLLGTLPPRFALAGLSLGGIVAMALVRRAPERVSGLCLMSTNSRAPTDEQRTAWSGQRRALIEGTTARDLQERLLPVLVAPENRSTELDEVVLCMADEVGDGVLDRQLAMQATRVDERPGLARVKVPTLILGPEKDALCPLDRHVEMRELIRGSRLEVIRGSGHLAPLEAPDAVAAALAGWLPASAP
ncbi:alpha/beta fold hydrolase [Amycolatopsis sp. NPDC058340]|uniref:alpha/beta fold hydrolase n=1 Tax=Amycolatopsis sp. NPDC058340 TaxID=3346453 RepID=UPI00364D291E